MTNFDALMNNFNDGYCEDVIKSIPDCSINLILTSPPYINQKTYGSTCSKIKSEDYLDWIMPKIHDFHRILRDDGSFVLNINNRVENNYEQLVLYDLVLKICREAGFNLVREYIWYNPSSPPNAYSRGTLGRTKKTHEHCYWFSKNDGWKFNMDPIRKPYSKDMSKYLHGEGKGNRKQNTRPSEHTFDCQKKWKDYGGADPGSVIVCGNNSSRDSFLTVCKNLGIQHPARFPLKLAEFFIKAGSDEGDIILDPFSGSGTTAVAAQRLNRKWIAIDCNEDYNKAARIRMKMECGDYDDTPF